MSFFNQIFGNRKSETTNSNNMTMENNLPNEMDEQRFENLFVNNEEPGSASF